MWACDPAFTSTIISSYQAAGPMFVQALETIFAAQCALVGDHVWPADATEAALKDPNYDFIIVGAGSAGSVLANRLSEVPEWKVLLVEAGGNPTLATEAPHLFYNNMGTTEDWGYKTEPQTGACRAYKGNQCAWPRGKTLGGCSSINAMFYVRGNKIDYDDWAANGNEGWSYDDVLPYFKKSENFNRFEDKNRKYHGTGGYLNVEKTPIDSLESIILTAASELGMKVNDDINAESEMGITKSFTTTKNGVRQSTARAFLNPVKERPNLHVIKNTLVAKILFKPSSKIVDGILITQNNSNFIIKAKKEVILSAGTVNSPQLLLLSGIGPKKQLEELKIDVMADLSVGENLQDHVLVPMFYKKPMNKNQSPVGTLNQIIEHLADFIIKRTGPFAGVTPHVVTAFVNTSDSAATSPDMQYHYLFFPPSLNNLLDVFWKHGLDDEYNSFYNDLNENNLVLIIYNVVLFPKSKGRIVLRSKDPKDHPLIYPNYFDNPEDMLTIIKGMQQTMKLAKTKTFEEFGLELIWPRFKSCTVFTEGSDQFLDCYARELTFSLYHPTGTVKMGPDDDETAIVNPELKVRKVKGLRVVDASIMPKITRGNTNAPTIMIAEKGADLIKKDWFNVHTEL
ncbi:glucose dehydrogenase [FAD, quinone]-like [Choristoneura fumiferana]|uniref:glucose dehydrogenase [FAD, quinone]-like n=1 Tax=Choristoneura fumiferana TaxID=7141 RepID=UPI003D15AF40